MDSAINAFSNHAQVDCGTSKSPKIFKSIYDFFLISIVMFLFYTL
jgi:hypothetical protein